MARCSTQVFPNSVNVRDHTCSKHMLILHARFKQINSLTSWRRNANIPKCNYFNFDMSIGPTDEMLNAILTANDTTLQRENTANNCGECLMCYVHSDKELLCKRTRKLYEAYEKLLVERFKKSGWNVIPQNPGRSLSRGTEEIRFALDHFYAPSFFLGSPLTLAFVWHVGKEKPFYMQTPGSTRYFETFFHGRLLYSNISKFNKTTICLQCPKHISV